MGAGPASGSSYRKASVSVGFDEAAQGVDEGQVGEGLGEVAEVLAGGGVDLLGIELRGPAKESSFWHRAMARSCSPIMARAVTSQKEQMVKVPSLPSKPVSVVSVL